MASGSFMSNTGTLLNLFVEWSSVPNIADNNSAITIKTYLRYYALQCNAKNATIVCDGQIYSYTTSSIYETSKVQHQKLLTTKTFTVGHNADGTKNIDLKATWAFNGSYGGVKVNTITATANVSLDDIPRASTIYSVTDSVEINGTNSVTAVISKKDSSYTHNVTFKINDTYTYEVINAGSTVTYAIPLAWINAIPNSTSGTAEVSVNTYNTNGEMVGDAISQAFAVIVPLSIVPSFDLEETIVSNIVPPSWDIYVHNKSKCKLEITNVESEYSATIDSCSIIGSGYASSSDTLQTDLLNAGSYSFTASVTDSRGRTTTQTKIISVCEYDEPAITSTLSQRCNADGTLNDDAGQYARCVATTRFASCGGHNSVTLEIFYRVFGSENWSSATNFTNNTAVVIGNNGFLTDTAYDIKYLITDALNGDHKVIDPLTAAFTTIEVLKGGKGVGIGIIPTLIGWLDVAFHAIFRKNVIIEGVAKQQGYPIMGYRGQIDISFNQLTSGGIYFYDHENNSQSSRPFDEDSVIEVIESPFSTTQRATSLVSNAMKYRSNYDNSWNDWSQNSGGGGVVTESIYTYTSFTNPPTTNLNIDYNQSGIEVVTESEEE